MPFLVGHTGLDTGVDYLEDWLDTDGVEAPLSANGGSSRARFLGTLAPRPKVPPWRFLPGAAGTAMTEVRNYLNELNDRGQNWGNHVSVTFPDADTPVRVDTGLGGPHQGFKVVGANGDIRVYQVKAPAGDPTPVRGVVWLRAAYDEDTLPEGESAKVSLYIY